MRRSMIGALVVLAVMGCSATSGPDAEQEAGALAAAQEYVDAIAARDSETADAMTNRLAFTSGDAIDIREALSRAQDPITDPWVSLVGPTYESSSGPVEYVIDVSYDLRDLTGGGQIVLQLKEDAEPTEIDSWVVTEPLTAQAATYSELSEATMAGMTLRYGSGGHQAVWGYPGGYLLQAPPGAAEADSVWIPVGAADGGTWHGTVVSLGSEG